MRQRPYAALVYLYVNWQSSTVSNIGSHLSVSENPIYQKCRSRSVLLFTDYMYRSDRYIMCVNHDRSELFLNTIDTSNVLVTNESSQVSAKIERSHIYWYKYRLRLLDSRYRAMSHIDNSYWMDKETHKCYCGMPRMLILRDLLSDSLFDHQI